jgi:hypothetical protein
LNKLRTVSTSDIFVVINGGPPATNDPNNAELARESKSRTSKQILNGDIPPGLRAVGLVHPTHPNEAFSTVVGRGFCLNSQPDIVDEHLTIGLRPGEIHMRQVLSVATACVARGVEGDGAVYLHQHQQTYLMKGGGQPVEEQVRTLARDSGRILDIQATLKQNRTSMGRPEKDSLNEESLELGARVQKTTAEACEILKTNLRKIG